MGLGRGNDEICCPEKGNIPKLAEDYLGDYSLVLIHGVPHAAARIIVLSDEDRRFENP